MDTIDVSNLNRQFLFRQNDVGKSKAETAAAFIMKQVKQVKVSPYYNRIQDFDETFYKQFSLIICGLDSVEARRWINATIYQIYNPNDPSSVIPLIDGGTEGFKGQSRVIIPGTTSCYECSLDMLTKKTTFPLCTIANTPRLPEHCIEWASVLEWPRWFPDKKLDTDDPEHLKWLYDVACHRAKQFNIQGVSFSLTQGVVKNIIPAIASTNAIIAASCCNEAFKMVTGCAPMLDSYMMYTGDDGIYTFTFRHDRKEDCPVCGQKTILFAVEKEKTLEDFIEDLKEIPQFQLKKPSLRSAQKTLYMQAPPPLEESTRPNLYKKLSELIQEGDEVTVTDVSLPFSMQLKIHFELSDAEVKKRRIG